MYDYVIIHGSYGHPFENWSPWLFNLLSSEGKSVLAPQFPCLDQCYDNWNKVMKAYLPFINERTSFIGHSLGPAFIIDFLIDNSIKANNLYLAAPFYGLINIESFDKVNKTFFKYDDLGQARKFFNKSFCFYSDNDPYVPLSLSKEFSDQLSATVLTIPNGGHLNASAGVLKFEELKEVIDQNG